MSVETWDARYATEDYVFGTAPSPFLEACRDRLPATGRALSLADGEGRNGVWLAGQGLDVLTLDFSAEGLAKARRLAAERGVAIRTEQADMLTWTWPDQSFDVVCAMNFHLPPAVREDLFRRIAATLAPGGLLLFEGIHADTRDHHPPETLFTEAMMPGLCDGLEIRETITRMEERRMDGEMVVKKKLNVLAVKP
ncbi:methyltransferase domain-containing protein [Roseospira visakhapatnamensis]|uniref:SAM-dependent methyltransferase n=1 Tax=Roseospira visakhapatnamensis TaxID=390880 RepID=A0A7W6WB73_9PROT|nr:SAM-dependent methyltransferase [Roseospira visakhapatnamensis]